MTNLIKSNICEYRIGNLEANLIPFFVLDISPPTTSQYKSFSTTQNTSVGGAVQEGYDNLILTWSNVTPQTVYRIKQRLDPRTPVYISAPKNDGTTINSRIFYNYSGYPQPIQVSKGGKQTGKGIFYQNLTLTISNVTVLGEA